jgi:hypothetical protein
MLLMGYFRNLFAESISNKALYVMRRRGLCEVWPRLGCANDSFRPFSVIGDSFPKWTVARCMNHVSILSELNTAPPVATS